MARWAIELSEFGIRYEPHLALKGQVLVDFLVELPQLDVDHGDTGLWVLNVDDSFYQTEASLQLKAPIGKRIEQAIRLRSLASNNKIEYEAILVKVDLTKSVSSENLVIRSNSQLVVG